MLEALQAFWEAAQRSLQSGGDASAAYLHQEGHAIMLRRIYRVMIKEFDAADCEKQRLTQCMHSPERPRCPVP